MGLSFSYDVKRIRETFSQSFEEIKIESKGKQKFLNDELAKYITDELGVRETPEGYLSFPGTVIIMSNFETKGALINVVPNNGRLLLQFIMENEVTYFDENTKKYGTPLNSGIHNVFEYEYIDGDKKVTVFIVDYGYLEDSVFVSSHLFDVSYPSLREIYNTAKIMEKYF